jgi:hypothetical protein
VRSTPTTSATAFWSVYVAQVAGSLGIVAAYFLIPLNLGPLRYAAFIALVGIGYLAPAFVDQILNTVLAFNVGRGDQEQLSSVVLAKLVATIALALMLWTALSRSGPVLIFGTAFAIAFALSNTLDTWLIAAGQARLLALYKILAAVVLTVALLIATPYGPEASAAILLGYYSVGAVGCGAVLVLNFEPPRFRLAELSGLGAAGPNVWFPVYSWLLPLVVLSAGHPVIASNLKLAVAFMVGLSLIAPVPAGLLTVAIAAQHHMSLALIAAVRRTIILALFAGIAGPVALLTNHDLFAAILSRFGFVDAASQATVASVALFPLLASPMLCARLYAGKPFTWGPITAYLGLYAATLALAATAPEIAIALIPIGHWLLFAWLAVVNRDLLMAAATRHDVFRISTLVACALLLIGIASLLGSSSLFIRLGLTGAFGAIAALLAWPYLFDTASTPALPPSIAVSPSTRGN